MLDYLNYKLNYTNFYQYPPPVNLVDKFEAKKINESIISKLSEMNDSSVYYTIYIGISFCRVKCNSCPFFVQLLTDKNRKTYNDYIEKLFLQIRKIWMSGIFKNKICDAIYFGGGTASLLQEKEIYKILNEISKEYTLSNDVEITLEGNPKDFTFNYLKKIKEYGINRVSIGLQSFNDKFLGLKILNSPHNSEHSYNSIENALKLNFNTVNIDLLYGLPHQSIEDWNFELDTVLNFKPENITTNHYVIHKKSKTELLISNGDIKTPDADSFKWREKASKKISKYGYIENRFESYILPNCKQKYSNLAYNKGCDIIGIGSGAYSFLNGYLISSPKSIKQYITMINDGFVLPVKYISEQATVKNLMERIIILNLISGIIDKRRFFKKFNTFPEIEFEAIFKKLLKYKLIEVNTNTINLTIKGVKWRKYIMSEFYSF